jgi:hypothetical protein
MAGRTFAVLANLVDQQSARGCVGKISSKMPASPDPFRPGHAYHPGQPPLEAMTHLANTISPRTHQMRLARLGIFALFAVTLMLARAPKLLPAEEPASKPVTPAAAAARDASPPKGPIQYVGPDTYILLDAQGRPQPVPGMTYEDFLAAWKKLNNPAIADSQPRFTIESIKIDGQTRGQRAELKFDVTIHLLADGAANVPLGLVGSILQGEPRFDKPDAKPQAAAAESTPPKGKPNDEYLEFDPQRGGFVAHVAGTAGERRALSFNLIAPLVRDGAETTLALSCPRATSSSLALTVDTPVTEARTSTGTVTSKKSVPEGSTHIDVAGLSGQFRLTWQSATTETASITSVLNAVGAIRVTIDGRGVRSDARLTVRSFGGAFDQFRIRLPRGAKLIRDPAAAGSQDPKYRISEEPLPPGPAKPAENAGQIVLVELKEKQQGPVVVDLSTEQPGHDVSQAIELAGFEVLGAVRQFGDIALNVANDWQARWNIGHDIRQVDATELDNSLQRTDLTAAFQYDRQPWSLAVHVAPRQSRVHVTPQYDLELLPEEARLTVRLAYQNFGARTYKFLIEIDGWELSGEPVESGGLVDQDNIAVSPTGTLTLPFAQASSRKAEVAFSLRHALDRDASTIKLPLPLPLADSVATGDLTVHSPADTELLPDLAHSTGLAASPAKETTAQPDPDAPAELHFRSLLPNAVFVASRTNRSREESAQITAKVEIAPDSTQVDERIDYQVRFEPIKELILEAPNDFPINEEGVEIALLMPGNGKAEPAEQRTPLHFEGVADEGELAASGTHHIRATLPQPRVGKFAISAHYQIAGPPTASAGSALQVALLSPVDASVTSQRATVRAPSGVFLSLGANADAPAWKMADPTHKKNSAGSGYEFVADRAEPLLPLLVSAANANAPSTTVVDRVWLQTWISGGVEQDRSVFHVRSSNSQATVELPPDAPPGEVEVLVDGQPAQVSSRAAGRIVVRLIRDSSNQADGAAEPTTHVLEIRFRRPIQQSLITRHRLTPPQIDATTELSQVYWQVVLPADEHIVDSPDQLVSASQWQWLGAFWGRRPVMSQTELEKWVGATAQIAPTANDNEYLFTGLLPVASIELVTAPRWLIVLAASSSALALLAGWFYLPLRLRPWILVAVIVLIAATAITYPTAAVLIAQAAAIGVVLALLSMFVSRWISGPTRRPLAQTFTPSSRRILTPRVDSIAMPPAIAAGSTSPTVSLRTSDSER